MPICPIEFTFAFCINSYSDVTISSNKRSVYVGTNFREACCFDAHFNSRRRQNEKEMHIFFVCNCCFYFFLNPGFCLRTTRKRETRGKVSYPCPGEGMARSTIASKTLIILHFFIVSLLDQIFDHLVNDLSSCFAPKSLPHKSGAQREAFYPQPYL